MEILAYLKSSKGKQLFFIIIFMSMAVAFEQILILRSLRSWCSGVTVVLSIALCTLTSFKKLAQNNEDH